MADKIESLWPEEWCDEDRMNFMFSAFPSDRTVNPKHWDSKLQFWTKLILDSCKSCDKIYTDRNTLREIFCRNGTLPLGLDIVLKEMLKSGKVQRIEDFKSGVDNGWISWTYGLVKKSVSWGLGTIWSSSSDDLEGTFVVVGRVKEKAESLLQLHHQSTEHDSTDHVLPLEVVRSRCRSSGQFADDSTLELVLCCLQKEKMIVIGESEDGLKVVKFASRGQRNVTPLVNTDFDIVRLKKCIAVLTLEVRKHSNEMESCRQKAAIFINQGQRKAAQNMLKRKQQQQRILDKKESSLASLQEILNRIQQAGTTKMIIDAMKSGSGTLKKVMSEEMDAEKVDKILFDLEESLADAEDIESVISQGNRAVAERAGIGEEDMEELERELGDLMLGDTSAVSEPRDREAEAMDKLAGITPPPSIPVRPPISPSDLPEVPSTSPVRETDRSFTRTRQTGQPLLS